MRCVFVIQPPTLGLRGAKINQDPKLITRVITFELTQRIRPRYINVTDGRTDNAFSGSINALS